MDTRQTVARIIESDDDVDKVLGGPEFVGSRKDIDSLMKEWSGEFLVEIAPIKGFTKHPNRVWSSAVPGRTMNRFEEEFDDALSERTESIDDLVLVLYESNEAATVFRRSAVAQMDQIVLPDVEVDCPLECDIWLKREDNEIAEAPRIDGVKPDRRRR